MHHNQLSLIETVGSLLSQVYSLATMTYQHFVGRSVGNCWYLIEQSEPIPGICASSVTWGRSVIGTARELLAETDSDNMSVGEKSAKAQAEEFLIQLLVDGPCPSQFVKTEARAAGISWATVLRAQNQSRATLETLSAVKNPSVVVAKQANITTDPQQVNNVLVTPCAGETAIRPNQLSGEADVIRQNP